MPVGSNVLSVSRRRTTLGNTKHKEFDRMPTEVSSLRKRLDQNNSAVQPLTRRGMLGTLTAAASLPVLSGSLGVAAQRQRSQQGASQANSETRWKIIVPDRALRQFEYFIGDWSMHNPKGDLAGGRMNFSMTWAPGRHMFTYTAFGTAPKLGDFQGSGMWGWDSNKEMIRVCEFWTTGIHNRYLLKIVNDSVLEGTKENVNPEGLLTTFAARVEKRGPTSFTATAVDKETGAIVDYVQLNKQVGDKP